MPADQAGLATSMVAGQRWMSQAEPELGLGTVVAVDGRKVDIEFAAADERRRYALASAPLRRVRFAVGDTIADGEGAELRIDGVDEAGGLLTYRCGQRRLPEREICDRIALGGPRERLLGGRTDAPALFELRYETLQRLARARRSPVRGFVGARLELLAHQFYIASEVASRHAPRVLLADETGLGKTIEACLAVNRLLLCGRASRVLIVVPDSLVNQWLVELRRRFDLRFAVFDEQRCQVIEDSDEDGANPFASEQLVLAGLGLIAGDRGRAGQAAEAGWDIVVVDEAHHLVWREDRPSAEYRAVDEIAARSSSLLLLTATPEQLGEHSHFARLRLLDPNRYSDFESWRDESRGYREAALIGERLIADEMLDAPTIQRLGEILDVEEAEIVRHLEAADGRRHVLARLIDRHGPGRVMFRNTRAAVTSFPQRHVQLHRLEPASAAAAECIGREVAADCTATGGHDCVGALAGDPRIEHLVELLRAAEPAKLLVICSSAAKARAIKAAIEQRIKVDTALFHEQLSLVQRDRNAAWFAEAGGARVLVCSEIGSEGRNFQHAQHLMMFDLPLDPDLVEQRIGRLDRIGQRGTVHIDVPLVAGTGLETLARWHDEGVGSFRRPTATARPLLERFGERVRELACASDPSAPSVGATLDALVTDTAAAARDLTRRVERGRDRLLEMASLRRNVAAELIDEITAVGAGCDLADFFVRVLEHFHVYAEEIGPRCYLLNPDAMRSAEFPALERGDTAVTFDRDTALIREDLEFVSWDYPLLGDAMELLLASEDGNAGFALSSDGPARMEFEAVFVLETVAPRRLHVERFLAPTPVRVVTDQALADRSETGASAERQTLGRGSCEWLARNRATVRALLERMAPRSEELAEVRAVGLRARARAEVREQLGAELERLRALAMVNDNVRLAEISAAAAELAELERHIETSRLRLDACRLVWHGPSRDGAPVVADR